MRIFAITFSLNNKSGEVKYHSIIISKQKNKEKKKKKNIERSKRRI